MKTFELDGRVLILASDPQCIDRQLQGEDLDLAQAGTLRDEVSTDELTPVPKLTYYDERLGRFTYTGFKAGDRFPIGPDAAREGGFRVTVAGARYGKGSSREHSPFAETLSGVRLIIAKSFERIYRQNADNIGLLTSTDFGLLQRLRAGEAIAIEELVASRDGLTKAIIHAGGLLNYGQRAMRSGFQSAPALAPGPRTLGEKIIARHRVATPETDEPLAPGVGLFVRPDWRYVIDTYTGMMTHMLEKAYGNPFPVHDVASILAFEDHFTLAHKSAAYLTGVMADFSGLSRAHREFSRQYGVVNHGALLESEGSEGICHPMMAERYALPGQLIVATDSHTPHSGAIGCVAYGIGTTDMANAVVTGVARMTMPESLLVRLEGSVPDGVTGKDIVLHLLARPEIRAGAGVGRLFEFAGPAIALLNTDDRATLTNMTAELGGFTGIIAPDAETVRFLKERRGIDFLIEDWMRSDPGCVHALTITIDCSLLSPIVAAPGDPGNGIALSQLRERPQVDIAYGGSCTGGKRADFDQYHKVLSWAASRGLAVNPSTALYLQFGTTAVRDYCVDRGYLDTFGRVGATILQPSCGACANLGPGGSTSPDQVTVSAQNRNFPGRSGPGKLWVASPATVAASAIAGRLSSFDELTAEYSLINSPSGPKHDQ